MKKKLAIAAIISSSIFLNSSDENIKNEDSNNIISDLSNKISASYTKTQNTIKQIAEPLKVVIEDYQTDHTLPENPSNIYSQPNIANSDDPKIIVQVRKAMEVARNTLENSEFSFTNVEIQRRDPEKTFGVTTEQMRKIAYEFDFTARDSRGIEYKGSIKDTIFIDESITVSNIDGKNSIYFGDKLQDPIRNRGVYDMHNKSTKP